MQPFTSMLPELLTGVLVLMTGILISKEPHQTRGSVLLESLLWGSGFFVGLSIEILTFANI